MIKWLHMLVYEGLCNSASDKFSTSVTVTEGKTEILLIV